MSSIIAPERITVITNTGGDDLFHGLYVSPDVDIIACGAPAVGRDDASRKALTVGALDAAEVAI